MGRGLLTATQSLLCFLSHIGSASSLPLCSRLRNGFILYPFHSKALVISVLFFKIIWILGFTGRSSRNTSALLYFTFYFSHLFNFSFDAHNLPFIRDCSRIITLPVSCQLQEQKSRGHLQAQRELSFSRPEIYVDI